MSTNPGIEEVAIRLILTVFAGALIGINRGEHGRAAGLRTTILVCLAAAVSMIQANLLLGSAGKAPDSFVVLDLMRLPLGILSGMGFIGAGAIIRRGDMVLGVTTAATLWFCTVMGLCFGGGQLWLGVAMLVIGAFVLWALKKFEKQLPQDRRAWFSLTCAGASFKFQDVRELLEHAGFRIIKWQISCRPLDSRRRLKCLLEWNGQTWENDLPPALENLANNAQLQHMSWKA